MDFNEEQYMDALAGMTEQELYVEENLVRHWRDIMMFDGDSELFKIYYARCECIVKYKQMCELLGL